jgi:hypothetical protein
LLKRPNFHEVFRVTALLTCGNGASPPPGALAFYGESLKHLAETDLPFLVGGTFAVCAYTGLSRPTKDIDLFCRPGDFPRVLAHFAKLGYQTEIEDERWLAKVRHGELFFDVIFNSTMGISPVTEAWFDEAHTAEICGTEVKLLPPTELIWSKVFVQDRLKYDGGDVAHLILRQHELIDWRRLLSYMDQYWEVLLIHVLNFRFIYPTERECIPRWLLDELLTRIQEQADLPVAQARVCRGRLFSRKDYRIDVTEWDFIDTAGQGQPHHEQP